MTCPVKQLSLFKGLSLEELTLLNKDRESYTFKAGEFIYEQGEKSKGLLALFIGKIKITKSGLFERSAIISLKKSGDFLGLEALITGKHYATSAIALENTSVCFLNEAHFLQVLKSNVNLSFRVMQLLANELELSNDRMLILTQKHMRGRLADALLLLRHQYGTKAGNQILNAELKRADLAAMANMTPANAIRILSHFVKENLIETNKRQIKVIDLEKLMHISQLG